MPGIDFAVLREEVRMQDVLNALGFEAVTRQGSQLHGPCPVHVSSSPTSRTFSVNLDSGRFTVTSTAVRATCWNCGRK